ncbi:MAG TPA: hypothetical protein VF790_03500 [Dissulfurispiraceae bacterium]
MMPGNIRPLRLFLFILIAAGIACSGPAYASAFPAEGGDALLDTYHRIEAKLLHSSFGVPLYLESLDSHHTIRIDTYGIFDYPFEEVRAELESPSAWCDIVSLHINVKGCIHGIQNGIRELTVYSGKKFETFSPDMRRTKYRYRIAASAPRYLDICLTADKGPFSTKNLLIRFEAIPVGAGRTFVHFICSYDYGFWTGIVMKSYFSTIGSGRAGFTVVGTDDNGEPVYVSGLQGAFERNAIRSYLAIQAYMDTRGVPEGARFEKRINRWYDLTSRYPKQLSDMEKERYLSLKRQERKDRMILQGRDKSNEHARPEGES